MSPSASSKALRLAGIAISVVSLAAVVWWASRQQAPRLPEGSGQWLALGASLAAYALATALRAERWLALLRREGALAGRADAYALTLAGFMGNNTLPARGGDAIRVYLMAPRSATRMRSVIGTLLAERVLDTAFLLSLFCLLAYGLMRGIDAPDLGLVALAAFVLAAALVLGVLFLRRLESERVRSVRELLRSMAAATRRLRGTHGVAMLALTISIWAAEAATYLLVGAAVGFEITVLESLYLVALASVFVLIPSGPGYAGTLDAAVVFGVRAIGGGGGTALSYLLLLRFVLLVPITLGGLVVLLVRYGWQPGAWRRPAPETQAGQA